MPSAEFRLNEENIIKEEQRSPGGSIVADDVLEDDFDDFVIIDKIDIKKYNKVEKI